MTVGRGLDPRHFSLLAFGGAGPLHAAGIADELGIETVLVPRFGGVFSALGLATADSRRDRVRMLNSPAPKLRTVSRNSRSGLARCRAKTQAIKATRIAIQEK